MKGSFLGTGNFSLSTLILHCNQIVSRGFDPQPGRTKAAFKTSLQRHSPEGALSSYCHMSSVFTSLHKVSIKTNDFPTYSVNEEN